MKAVVLHEADAMRVEQRPLPEPGPGEVLLKVNVTSICGTDVKVLHRKLLGQPEGPFIMGHEYAGTVAALGPEVDEFKVGDRVAVEVHKGCERCENCIKGWYTSCLSTRSRAGPPIRRSAAAIFATSSGACSTRKPTTSTPSSGTGSSPTAHGSEAGRSPRAISSTTSSTPCGWRNHDPRA